MTEPAVHVVEDDDALRDSMRFLLRAAGLPWRLYASGQALLDAVAEGAVAGCVVTDLRMPQMDGLELLEKLKADGFAAPVFLMSGHGDQAIAAEARAAGAAGFFQKPFEEEVFLAEVRRGLAASPAEPAAPEAARRPGLLDLLAGARRIRPGA